jgi:hypothetical protein
MPLTYTYDRNLQRYRRDDGKFVSAADIQDLTKYMIEKARVQTSSIANELIEGKIELSEWTRQTALQLKEIHSQQYLLGRGGLKNMTQRDYGILGARLKKEYKYLNNFATDIRDKQMSIAQFQARLNLYLSSTDASYQAARREAHKSAGFTSERRRLGSLKNCPPCGSYAGMGWVAIGTLPAIATACDCKANCKCFFEYSKDEPDGFLNRSFGWVKGGAKRQSSFSSW